MQQETTKDEAGVSRRTTLTLATGVAALGVALGLRSNAFAQDGPDQPRANSL
jgi:hypothetical protein